MGTNAKLSMLICVLYGKNKDLIVKVILSRPKTLVFDTEQMLF